MKKTLNVVAVILISCALVAWGLTTTTGVHLINSVIDSTPIGNTTPATGRFTSVSANSGSFGYVGTGIGPATSPQGAYLGWNLTGGGGETDFVNSRGNGGGGWSFFNVPTGGAIGSPVARIDNLGNFFAPSFNGSLNGNATSANTAGSANTANTANSATSANVLNSSVHNCAATTPATGIQANGDAVCGSYPSSISQPSGYDTLPNGLIIQWTQGVAQTTSGGTQVVNFPIRFPHNCFSVQASALVPSPVDAEVSFYQVVGWSALAATVYLSRNADRAFQPTTPLIYAIGN